MKIYTKIVIDMSTFETISEESYEYHGEIARCSVGGGDDGGGEDPGGGLGPGSGAGLYGNESSIDYDYDLTEFNNVLEASKEYELSWSEYAKSILSALWSGVKAALSIPGALAVVGLPNSIDAFQRAYDDFNKINPADKNAKQAALENAKAALEAMHPNSKVDISDTGKVTVDGKDLGRDQPGITDISLDDMFNQQNGRLDNNLNVDLDKWYKQNPVSPSGDPARDRFIGMTIREIADGVKSGKYGKEVPGYFPSRYLSDAGGAGGTDAGDDSVWTGKIFTSPNVPNGQQAIAYLANPTGTNPTGTQPGTSRYGSLASEYGGTNYTRDLTAAVGGKMGNVSATDVTGQWTNPKANQTAEDLLNEFIDSTFGIAPKAATDTSATSPGYPGMRKRIEGDNAYLKALTEKYNTDMTSAESPYKAQLQNILAQRQGGTGDYGERFNYSFGGKAMPSFIPKTRTSQASYDLGLGKEGVALDQGALNRNFAAGSEYTPNKAANTYADKLLPLLQFFQTGKMNTNTADLPEESNYSKILKGLNAGTGFLNSGGVSLIDKMLKGIGSLGTGSNNTNESSLDYSSQPYDYGEYNDWNL